jgi:hypothetical protein
MPVPELIPPRRVPGTQEAEVDVSYPDDEQTHIPWSRPAARTHPVLAAVLALAVGIGTWVGLVSYLRASRARPTPMAGPIVMHAPRASAPTVGSAPPSPSERGAADTASGIAPGRAPTIRPDTAPRAHGATGHDTAPAPRSAVARDSEPPAGPAHADTVAIASARIRAGATSTAPSDSAGAAPSTPAEPPNLSPFLLSHPWAAVPGQRYYYPSGCPATLRLRDLVFFRTEEQARAQGFERSPSTACQ